MKRRITIGAGCAVAVAIVAYLVFFPTARPPAPPAQLQPRLSVGKWRLADVDLTPVQWDRLLRLELWIEDQREELRALIKQRNELIGNGAAELFDADADSYRVGIAMADWFIETGFGYLLGVAMVALVGLVLVYRGLWGDHSKGRTRCPKCWYDMRGTVPKLECPECGHDAGQEGRLRNNRRRWGRTVAGVVLVLLSAYPLHIVGGWWREQAIMRRYRNASIDYETIGPVWLVERLPDELGWFFERIDVLFVMDPAQLAACRSLRHLRSVWIMSGQVTDADLVHLKGLSDLELLNLLGTQVTDAGLVHLKGLSELELLFLNARRVTDAGVAELQQALPNVRIRR